VKIWEQVSIPESEHHSGANAGSQAYLSGSSRWVERAILSDAKGTVRSVEFCPHYFGLKLVRLFSKPSVRWSLLLQFLFQIRDEKLTSNSTVQATISTDNMLRIYDCIEQPSLTSWQLTEEFDVQVSSSIPPTSFPPATNHSVSPHRLKRTHSPAAGAAGG
jgi:nucleoporin SEH1